MQEVRVDQGGCGRQCPGQNQGLPETPGTIGAGVSAQVGKPRSERFSVAGEPPHALPGVEHGSGILVEVLRQVMDRDSDLAVDRMNRCICGEEGISCLG